MNIDATYEKSEERPSPRVDSFELNPDKRSQAEYFARVNIADLKNPKSEDGQENFVPVFSLDENSSLNESFETCPELDLLQINSKVMTE